MKIIKIILIGTVFLILLAGIALFIFIKTFNIDDYKLQIESKISQAIQKHVTIGKISFQFGGEKVLFLKAKNVDILEQLDQTSAQLLQIKSLDLDVDIAKFVKDKEIRVSRIIIHHPTVHLVLSDKQREENNQTKTNVGKRSLNGKIAQKDMQRHFNFDIESIMLKQGKVIIHDEKAGRDYEINDIDINVGKFALNKVSTFMLKASFLSNQDNINLKGQLFIDSKKKQIKVSQVKFNTSLQELSSVKLLNNFPNLIKLGFDQTVFGSLILKCEDILIDHRGLKDLSINGLLSDGKFYFKPLDIPLSNIDIRFDASLEKINIRQLFMYVDSGKVNVSGLIDEYLSKQIYSMKMNAEDIPLESLLKTVEQEIEIQGLVNTQLTLKGEGINLSAIKTNLVGEGQVDVRQGRLVDFNLLKFVLNQMTMIPDLVQSLLERMPDKYIETMSLKDTLLNEVKFDVNITPGKMILQEGKVIAEGFGLKANGEGNFEQKVKAQAEIIVERDLSKAMIDSVPQLSGLLNQNQEIRIPMTDYQGPLHRFKMQPNIKHISQKVIVETGKQELRKAIFKALDIEEIKPPSVTETDNERDLGEDLENDLDDEQMEKDEDVSVEEVLIDTVLDAIFQ